MIRRPAATFLAAGLLALALPAVPPLGAQTRAPRAVLTPSADPAAVRPGKTAKLRLEVALPEKIHVQSNKPRDAAFFPTALVLTPPPGVTVTSTVYPAAVDFVQEGQAEPLAVFEKTFTVTATISVAGSVKPGPVVVPGRFDYQACDDKVCYRPVKSDVSWTLAVTP